MTATARKRQPQDWQRQKTEAEALSFVGYKPNAVVFQHAKPKPPRVEYEEVFGVRRQTTGEHMSILHAWIRLKGYPAINQNFGICSFASVFERYVKPRHAWRHFFPGQTPDARKFLAQWASALLPQVMEAVNVR